MSEQEQTEPRGGINHDRIDQLTKEYRQQMEADEHDPVAERAAAESAQWAEQVASGRYPELEKQRHLELKAIRERLHAGDGLMPSAPEDPAPAPDDAKYMPSSELPHAEVMSDAGRRTEPLRALDPAELARQDANLAREQTARAHNVNAMYSGGATHPDHPSHERLATHEDIHALQPIEPEAPVKRPRLHHRAINRAKSFTKRVLGRS